MNGHTLAKTKPCFHVNAKETEDSIVKEYFGLAVHAVYDPLPLPFQATAAVKRLQLAGSNFNLEGFQMPRQSRPHV